jgi:cell division protein FtsW (lipid II flippase)/cell division protein FtsI/penicillin-binding protein 2
MRGPSTENFMGRQKENWLLLCGAAVLMLVLFLKLYWTLQPSLEAVEASMNTRSAIRLEPGVQHTALKKILYQGNYFSDPRDVDLLADSLAAKLRTIRTIDNLGALNKNSFSISVDPEWNPLIGGAEFQGRLQASRQRLGFDSVLYRKELSHPQQFSSSASVGKGKLEISGQVFNLDEPMSSVLIQLREHIAAVNDEDLIQREFYVRTDKQGKFSFTGLQEDSGYSIVPLKPGYEFGGRQGAAQLQSNRSFKFTARPHMIRLIGPIVYAQIKEDGLLMVRTPEEFRSLYWIIVATFLLSFFVVNIIFQVRKITPDGFILPILLLLSGISILMLFCIQDPLADTLLAAQALQGVIVGLAGFTMFSMISIGKFYSRWWFDWLFNFKKKNFYQLKGWTWLVLALLMALLTLVAGTGPEGSGVKVNLQLAGFTFQPSEITKYLLLLFFAGFFASNEEYIRKLSDIRWRFLINWTIMVSVAVILILYLLMGDMGPALVVCLTFLVFYSIARGNLLLTIIAGILYGTLLYFLPALIATLISLLVVCLVMLFSGSLRTTKWYGALAFFAEAPVIILMIMAVFTFGDQLPGIGERLADRKAMWLSQWNNDVFGGDHLAHGYWTLASGGWTGQGLGKGYPNTMPAAHTDMILPSIGEELGWIGLLSLFLLYYILVHRIFLHARRAGQPFSFYLCAGIGIASSIQLLLIAGGSIGLLPLTGLTVPFLSYGKISLIINLAAMGIVAGLSARPGLDVQKEHIRNYYDPVLMTGIAGFLAGVIALSVKLFFIQVIDSKDILVKQARVINRNGLPIYSYNPRIDKLTKLLAAGNIYDRNGLIIATSERDSIKTNLDALQAAGIDRLKLQSLMNKKVRRFYPFEEQLFYWTGDYNTRLFWGQQNGYFAEARHLSALRGFETRPVKHDFIGTAYRPDRFTKPVQKTVQLVSYDYTELSESLASGIDTTNEAVRKIKYKNREVWLTLDAALQKEIQDSLQVSAFRNKRISVVVLDAATGDLLASALYPMADLKAPDKMLLQDRERRSLPTAVTERDLGMTYATAPGSTVKILTAMAALNKIGTAATEKKYRDISRAEIFRDNAREQEPFIPKVPFVDMREAIINSSNIFFIRMANENYLEEEMATLYQLTGMNINQRGGYDYEPVKDQAKRRQDIQQWRETVLNNDRHNYNNPAFYGKQKRYQSLFSGLAWGQSRLTATPVSMARMAGAIANNGILQPSRFVIKETGEKAKQEPGVSIAKDSVYANLLTGFMIEQSNVPGKPKIKGMKVAGKTGTPERVINSVKGADGWYVFFAPAPGRSSHTVTCIRIEAGMSSANAVILANKVAPILKKRNYIESF